MSMRFFYEFWLREISPSSHNKWKFVLVKNSIKQLLPSNFFLEYLQFYTLSIVQ